MVVVLLVIDYLGNLGGLKAKKFRVKKEGPMSNRFIQSLSAGGIVSQYCKIAAGTVWESVGQRVAHRSYVLRGVGGGLKTKGQ
jgi:hypothetical protein